jgi:hypothetical protein
MFILYAVLAGLALGLLTGGSTERLGRLTIHWGLLIAVGMVAQLALFSTPVGGALGPWAPWAYAATNAAVLIAVARNLRVPGLALVLVGGVSNALAIIANGGYMPVAPAAIAAMGRSAGGAGYSNSKLMADVQLWPLTDLFAMPTWVPAANVFSVGDVLIGVGAAIAIVAAMHGRGPLQPAPLPRGASAH